MESESDTQQNKTQTQLQTNQNLTKPSTLVKKFINAGPYQSLLASQESFTKNLAFLKNESFQ